MMTRKELEDTIDWLREFVHRLEDRDDYEAFSEVIARLKQSIKDLEARTGNQSSAGGTDKLVCP